MMDNNGKFAILIGTFTLVITMSVISIIATNIYLDKTSKFAKKGNIFSNGKKLGNVKDTITLIRTKGMNAKGKK
jgi:hypothetical protein